MNHQLEKMQGLYEKLAALLSEAAVAPESLDKYLGFISSPFTPSWTS